eukprot:m.50522 g.50522  ORF g.50522 m.50522 type:complete len:484 (-) comp12157_c0_seq1:211-1662(-)
MASIYLFCAFCGIGGLLFGYDIGVISGVLEMQSFKDLFQYTDWQKGFIVTSFIVGCAVGAFSSGMLGDRLGRRWSIATSCIVFCCGGIVQSLAKTFPEIYAGRFVAGAAVGVTSALVPLYNSEIAPPAIRGRLITFNQIAMTGGIMIAFWIGYALQNKKDGWRIAIALQCVPAVFLACSLMFLPNTPRWLVKTGRIEDARASLQRLRRSKNVGSELTAIKHSIEQETGQAGIGWTDFFSVPSLRRRLLIGIAVQSFQQLTGINSIMYYCPQIFSSVGFHRARLLAQGINGVVNFLATFLAFWLVDRFGRKTLLIAGGLGMSASMVTLFMLGHNYATEDDESGHANLSISNKSVGLACVAAVYIFVASFAYSWGPVGWLLPTELFPLALRARGVSITTGFNFSWNILIGQFVPKLQTDIGFWLYLIFGGLCLIMALFTQLVVPETKGLTLESLNAMLAASDLQGQGTPVSRAQRRSREIDPLLS